MNQQEFPLLQKEDITYLDSACMTLRPEPVIKAVEKYYRNLSSCPGRSSHSLAQETTERIEESRKKLAELIDADPEDLVFTSGTTEAINTVSHGLERDKAVISDKEHNSNILPWQDDNLIAVSTCNGFNLQGLEGEIDENTLVSVVHRSNLDGSKLPIKAISDIVEDNDAYLMVDAAQSVGHQKVSVEDLEPDFMAFSGHKMLGPSGTGGLYVADRVKDELKPMKRGGGAVNSTTFQSFEPRKFPYNMEPGLPNAAGIIGLKEAAQFIMDTGIEKIERHERDISDYFYSQVDQLEKIQNIGERGNGVFSINIEGISAHQAGLMLDRKDIMVRSGKHCVHPWFEKYGEQPTLRASTHIYNTKQDVDNLISELKKIALLKS